MRYFPFSVLVTVVAIACTSVQAQTTTVAFDSGSQFLYSNAAKTVLLSGGVAATLGDGAMLQLGYYNQATVVNPFAGTFVLIAGAGSPNTFPTYGNNISIGDDPVNGASNGTYALQLSFTPGTATGNNLPVAGQELAIRFFNNTTLANSTAFNAVNAPTWLWQAPATPPSTVNLSLDDLGIRFQDGTTNSFYTSLPNTAVPEPASYVLIGGLSVCVIGLTRIRRTRA